MINTTDLVSWKNLSFFLPVFFLTYEVLAQRGYFFTSYGDLTGAPFSEVFEIASDDRGFIWIASDRGLYRFNGMEFESYNLKLKSRTIHGFAPFSPDTLLFVNDLDVYGIKHLPADDQVHGFFKQRQGSTIELQFPNNIFVDRGKEVWISETNDRVIKYNARDQISLILPLPASPSSKSTKTYFAQDGYGTIWLIRHHGEILTFNKEEQSIESVTTIESPVHAIQLKDDTLWIGSEELLGFQISDRGNLTSLPSIPIPGGKISAMNLLDNGIWMIGTEQGRLFQRYPGDRDWIQIYGSNDPHRMTDLPLGSVHQIHIHPTEGEQELIWVAHQNGLYLLQTRFFEMPQGLNHDHTISLLSGRENDVLVSFGDLHKIHQKLHWFESVKVGDFERITAIEAASSGIWLGNSYAEMLLLDRSNRVSNRLNLSQRGGAIFYIYLDSSNTLWFCQSPRGRPIIGVGRVMTDGSIREYGEEKGLTSRALVVKQDMRGTLYAAGIGVDSYLSRYVVGEDRFENISLSMPFSVDHRFEVHDLAIDPRGIIWLATTDGLLTHDGEKIIRVDIPREAQQEIRSVGCTQDGAVWAATATNGVIYHQNGQTLLYDESSGLPSVINSYRSLSIDPVGRIWIGTDEGVALSAAVNPKPLRTRAPTVKSYSVGSHSTISNGPQRIRLNTSQPLSLNLVTQAYPATHFRLQYRVVAKADLPLIHPDEAWQDSPVRDAVDLTALNVGTYELQMRTKLMEGYLWSIPLVYELDVRRPIYRDPRFLLAVAALIIFLFWSYLRLFFTKRVQYMEKILSSQKKALLEKDQQLVAQTKEMDTQKEDYEEAVSNIAILYRFIHQIPQGADWNYIIMSIGKALDAQEGIQAFELAYVKGADICYRGYSTKERGNFTFRSKPFNAKTSLTCWSIEQQEILVVNDFVKEHGRYVQTKEKHLYQSMAFVPFTLGSGRQAALCAYSIDTNQYQKHDILMLQILADYVARSAASDLE